MELSNLISEIKREGKMTSDDIMKLLAESVEDKEDISCVYEKLFKKAYGGHLSESICRDWVSNMTHGEKWSYEQTTDYGQKHGVNWANMNKYEWYAAMNASYSDNHLVGIEYQVDDDPDFYAGLAKAFWCMDDDVHDKTVCSYYFNYVA